MPVITTHQFLDQYPVRQTDTKMVLGTIHPHNHDIFLFPFFYGNVGSFWDILNHAYPRHNLTNLRNISTMLSENNVWDTDIIRQCERENAGVTNDSELYNIVPNTEQITQALLNSQIDTIYFTSAFGKNNAAKLFIEHLGIDYLPTYDELKREFTIPENRFGRPIRCIVLYSPSNMANRGISRCLPYRNNIHHYQQFPFPVKAFKVDHYRERFGFLA